LQRARETAELIGDKLNMSIVTNARLKEYDVGDIAGLTWEQVTEQYPDLARQWEEGSEYLEFPNAEASDEFRTRVSTAFDEIIAQHPNETVSVISHGVL